MNKVVAIFGLAFAGLAVAQAPGGVNLYIVKYDALTAAVRKAKGRVVVVDVWADYCVPCKREFPGLVRLHRQFSKDGLTAISVSVDAANEANKDRCLKFLSSKEATFTNFLLDERADVWQNKFKADGPPCVIVFNRRGELVQRFVDQKVDYKEIEKLVVRLLRE